MFDAQDEICKDWEELCEARDRAETENTCSMCGAVNEFDMWLCEACKESEEN